VTRAAARWIAGLVAALAMLLSGTGIASAHPTLLFTDPGTDTAVAQTPQEITLVFNEAVTLAPAAVRVFDTTGREFPIATVGAGHDGKVVTARPAQPLPAGIYTVRWRATGTDGDLVEEDFRFAVGVALTGRRRARDRSCPTGPTRHCAGCCSPDSRSRSAGWPPNGSRHRPGRCVPIFGS
jgi:methionine-rich copper-binding protein CopC